MFVWRTLPSLALLVSADSARQCLSGGHFRLRHVLCPPIKQISADILHLFRMFVRLSPQISHHRSPNISIFGGHLPCQHSFCPPRQPFALTDASRDAPAAVFWRTLPSLARLVSAASARLCLSGGHSCLRRVLCPPPRPAYVCLADTPISGASCVRRLGPKPVKKGCEEAVSRFPTAQRRSTESYDDVGGKSPFCPQLMMRIASLLRNSRNHMMSGSAVIFFFS